MIPLVSYIGGIFWFNNGWIVVVNIVEDLFGTIVASPWQTFLHGIWYRLVGW